MKNSKLTKFLAPVVAISLLIGALVGINVFAADTPEIVSMNVEYGSELYLYYAVDKASIKGTPALEVVTADGTVIKTVTKYEEETVNDKECYIFKTAGIAPGQINVIEYVRASGDNGKGDIVSYSVEEYLYTRLFKQGFAAKTEADGSDYTRRNLYFGLLEYARSAQNLFYRDSEDKIADSTYVAIKGNASASGVYEFAEIITLAAPAIDGFDYWKVTEMTIFGKVLCERKLEAGFVYTVTNSAVIVPVTDDDNAEGIEVYDPSVVTFDGGSDKVSFALAAANGTTDLVYDAEEGNWYYSIHKKNTGTGVATFNILPTGGDPTTATVMVVEFDIYLSSDASIKNLIQSNIVTNAANKAGGSSYLWAPFLHAQSDRTVLGAWNHFKIVYEPTKFIDPNVEGDTEAFTAKIYINDMESPVKVITENYSKYGRVSQGDGKNADIPKLTDIYAYTFSFNGRAYGDFKLDNVSLIFE